MLSCRPASGPSISTSAGRLANACAIMDRNLAAGTIARCRLLMNKILTPRHSAIAGARKFASGRFESRAGNIRQYLRPSRKIEAAETDRRDESADNAGIDTH